MDIVAHTCIASPPLVPELRLRLVTPECQMWYATEEQAQEAGLIDSYWAFAWAGGQAVARYVLDHPDSFTGRRVLDFGAGGGIVAIAAARVGARVTAADVDAAAVRAIALNAALNEVEVASTNEDLIGVRGPWDVVLAGDVTYEAALAVRVLSWFRALAEKGITVLFGDPHRGFIDAAALRVVATYDAPADNDPGARFSMCTSVYSVDPRNDKR